MKDVAVAALETVAAPEVDEGTGRRSHGGGRAGVITVEVRQQYGGELTAESLDLLEDRSRARSETRIDKSQATVVGLNEVDVRTTSAVEPPKPGCEDISQPPPPASSVTVCSEHRRTDLTASGGPLPTGPRLTVSGRSKPLQRGCGPAIRT